MTIIKTIDGKYYDVESYGCSTWGSCSQQSNIVKTKGIWYIVDSVCVDREFDEWEVFEEKLDVEEVLYSIPDGVVLENQEDYNIFISYFGKESKNGR